MISVGLQGGGWLIKFIFIDNWVLSSLQEPGFFDALKKYILDNNFTVLFSSLSLVELYNPGWQNSNGPERTQNAVKFYASVPCAVVDPLDVWKAEIKNRLDTIDQLPIRLDLRDLDDELREETLLRFLRADPLFLDQGKDIREWVKNYNEIKNTWLVHVEKIIDNALRDGYLERDSLGKLCKLNQYKDLFLYSLDMRHALSEEVDAILEYQVNKRRKQKVVKVSAIRMTSLIYWYLYVKIDPVNKVKVQNSDIGDLYHLSLLPYCKAFTADKSMCRLVRRIKEPCVPIGCRVLSKPELLKAIGLK